MAIKVSVPSASTRSVHIVTSNSKQTTATAIGQLQGVDVTGVEDGYTLLYNGTICFFHTFHDYRVEFYDVHNFIDSQFEFYAFNNFRYSQLKFNDFNVFFMILAWNLCFP